MFRGTMKVLAVGLILGSGVLTGCVSGGKYRILEDELARTQDDLSRTSSSLAETEDMLVDAEGERSRLMERASLADQLAAEKAALQARLDEMLKNGAVANVDGTVLFTQDGEYGYRAQGDVIFAPGSDKLTKDGERILSNLSTELKKNGYSIRVVGHTDSDPIVRTADKWTRGNIELGANRAMSVRDFLITQGIPESRVSIASFGPHRPLAKGTSSEAKAKNRRVEVMVAMNETKTDAN